MNAARLALVALIAFLAALFGTYVGRTLSPAPLETGAELHEILHDEVNLDKAQEQRVEQLEDNFQQQREALEARLRADNRRLAEAISAEHVYGPRVAAAVDATHHSMGALQNATLEHIFAMRAVLRPDQAARFDAAVVKALTAKER